MQIHKITIGDHRVVIDHNDKTGMYYMTTFNRVNNRWTVVTWQELKQTVSDYQALQLVLDYLQNR